MKSDGFYLKYSIAELFITIAVIFSVFKIQNITVSILGFILFTVYFGLKIGAILFQKNTLFWKIFFGIIMLLVLYIVILSPIYWFYEINKYVFAATVIFVAASISIYNKKIKTGNLNPLALGLKIKEKTLNKLMVFTFLCSNFLLFYNLIQKNYGDTMSSPWTIIGPRFFILFLFSTFVLLLFLQFSKNKKIGLLLTFLHFALILNVAFIIFKYGFGFDPFIHQATEKVIKENGFITPKQPYYIGHYMTVLLLNYFTKIPLNIIDSSLVPILASAIMPLSTYFVFKNLGFKKYILISVALLPMFPLTFFIQTTPNNFALLLSYITFLWIWFETKNSNKYTKFFGIFLSLAVCAIHPLIGLPTLIIYAGSKLPNKKTYGIIYFFILALVVPAAILINNIRSFGVLNLSFDLQNFINLFSAPYWFIFENAPTKWQLLYNLRIILYPILIIFSVMGIYTATKKYKIEKTSFFVLTIGALFFSSIIISSAIVFKDVVSYEQTNYAKRLFSIIHLLLLPFFLIFIYRMCIIFSKKNFYKILFAFTMSFALLFSFYFTYPTRDPVSFYTGFSIRDIDLEVVHFIEERNKDKNYIVLTNQTISSAAIKEFGFKKYYNTVDGPQYFYSIPTGGPLYKFFGKMVYEGAKKEYMLEAMKYAGVEKAYFVHTSYWAPAAEIRDTAKLEADNWWNFGPDRVWVYEYIKNPRN